MGSVPCPRYKGELVQEEDPEVGAGKCGVTDRDHAVCGRYSAKLPYILHADNLMGAHHPTRSLGIRAHEHSACSRGVPVWLLGIMAPYDDKLGAHPAGESACGTCNPSGRDYARRGREDLSTKLLQPSSARLFP